MQVRLRKQNRKVAIGYMDSISEMAELSRYTRDFHYPYEGRDTEVDYIAKGVGEEAGEILGVLKKMDRGDPEATNDWLLEEISDLFYYILRLCKARGIDPRHIGGLMQMKLLVLGANKANMD